VKVLGAPGFLVVNLWLNYRKSKFGGNMKPSLLILAALLAMSLIAACAPVSAPAMDSAPAVGVGIANPASENCVAQGGTLEIRQGDGGEVGYCLFADGSECEEWSLMRGECAPGQSLATYDDPFAYCAAVGTLDAPDSRYIGEQPPAAVIEGIRAVFDAPADTPDEFYTSGAFWRCADGQVKACFVGANLPCDVKADLSETPNDGIVAYCQENPDADVVPAAAAGRATVFSWSCAGGGPVLGEQVVQADAQGFIADFWYVIEPPAATSGAYMPIPDEACATLKSDAEAALGVSFTMTEAPFFDYLSQEGGAGCQLLAEGTGADFADPMTVVDALKAAFVGWEEDMQYAAGGPTGMGIGMTRDAALLLILAEWKPDPAANCPDDQPISACELTPEQQLYTVTVQAAMK
jgi:putative hemolysin